MEHDPLAETELLEDLVLYLSRQFLSMEAKNRYSRLLSHRRFVDIQRTVEKPTDEANPEVIEEREIELSEEEGERKRGAEQDSGANVRNWNTERTKRFGEADAKAGTGAGVPCGSLFEAKIPHPPSFRILLHAARSRFPTVFVPWNFDAKSRTFRTDLREDGLRSVTMETTLSRKERAWTVQVLSGEHLRHESFPGIGGARKTRGRGFSS